MSFTDLVPEKIWVCICCNHASLNHKERSFLSTEDEKKKKKTTKQDVVDDVIWASMSSHNWATPEIWHRPCFCLLLKLDWLCMDVCVYGCMHAFILPLATGRVMVHEPTLLKGQRKDLILNISMLVLKSHVGKMKTFCGLQICNEILIRCYNCSNVTQNFYPFPVF